MAIERTLVFIKPDGIQKKLVGKVLTRYEEKGFKLIALKQFQLTREMAEIHYAEHQDKPFFDTVCKAVTSAPVVAFVLEGNNVIASVRLMNGATDGSQAEPGTIRGDYSTGRDDNVLHASDSLESAAREIQNFFGELA